MTTPPIPSALLSRHLTLDAITVQPFAGIDGQGRDTYGPATSINARVVERHEVRMQADGTSRVTDLMLWAPVGTTPMPTVRDRVGYNNATYVVEEYKDVKTFRGALAHRRLRCRRDGGPST